MTRPHEDVIREALMWRSDVMARDALDALAALVDERDRLREALRRHGVHMGNCHVRDYPGLGRPSSVSGQECDCGLDAALAASPGDKTPEASGPDEQEAGA